MQFQLPASPRASITRNVFRSKIGLKTFQSILKSRRYHKELLPELLERRWALLNPDASIHKVSLFEAQLQHREGPNITFSFTNNTRPSLGNNLKEKTEQELSFYVVRDDLLHPLVNGNKARKLDGLLPLIEDHAVTDVVTCGGCQSAHAAAVAVSCAERGLRSHLLLRGEQPEIPTGYNLISAMYGNVMYVPRSLYAKREEMLSGHADIVAGRDGTVVWSNNILDTSLGAQEYGKANFVPLASHQSSFTGTDAMEHQRKVAIVNEGAGDVAGLLGVIRVVEFLSRTHLFRSDRALKIVVDAGTGTTAVGLGLGAVCLSLPWEVRGVMLADTIEGYKKQEEHLILEFKRAFGIGHSSNALNRMDGGIVHWVERIHPRKFGNVLKGEVEMCQQIARQTGILVDPIYTLAAWEHATLLCQSKTDAGADVVMLHTGGTLGIFGLAQRYKSYFDTVQYADYSNLS